MSLNWNISKVENWKQKSDENWDLLNNLIWGALSIGLQKITPYNTGEWLYRMNRILLEYGQYESMFTIEQIEMFIGLETNVGTISAAEFEKKIKQQHPERFKMTIKQLNKGE